jgi:DNA processing protein
MARPEPPAALSETAALVALLRDAKRPLEHYSDLVEESGSAQQVLEEEHGLLASRLHEAAAAELAGWLARGIQPVTVLDPGYPENLRAVHDRPPLIFLDGQLVSGDARSVAVIGSRRATQTGIERARGITEALIGDGYTVVSGLATGIDTAAHTTALEHEARTIAVIGTGVERSYPPENASLQRRIAGSGAVVSQFWPDDGPGRYTFPARNAVMSGLSLATVIVEASHRSGARIQARQALAHGRPVLLVSSLLDQGWARELARRPGTHVVDSSEEVLAIVDLVSSIEAPVT